MFINVLKSKLLSHVLYTDVYICYSIKSVINICTFYTNDY